MDDSLLERTLRGRLQFIPGLPILVVVGPRRVGKTTLLRGWYNTLGAAPKAWLDGDSPAHLQVWERLRAGQDGRTWVYGLTGGGAGTERFLFLDEAQALPDASRLVKYLADHIPELRIAVSGSSALKLKGLSSESMAGRKQLLELYPLSLAERIGYPNPADARLRRMSPEDLRLEGQGLLLESLVWGGYPGALTLGEAWQRQAYLADVVDSVLYRDLLGEVRDKDVTAFKLMLARLARAVSARVNVSSLAQELGLNRQTVSRYLGLLEQAGLLVLLPGIAASGIVAKAQPKVYFTDNGLLSMLMADDRPFEVRKPEDRGALLENLLVAELVKRYQYAGDQLTRLGYLWHPKGELDVVAYRNGGIQRAWEVKLTVTRPGGVREIRDELGDARLSLLNLDNAVELLVRPDAS